MQRTFKYRRFEIFSALSLGLFLTVASALPGALEAQTTGTATLTVHVTGARNAKGKIRVALFRDGKGFPNDASQAVHTQAADIDPQTLSAQVVFADILAGVYAVSVVRPRQGTISFARAGHGRSLLQRAVH